jgi:FemAB-related protein (PEP-CTERM system-associated)
MVTLQVKVSRDQIKIKSAEDRDAERWEAYVLSHPRSTFFHRIGWRGIFKKIFQLEPHYLIAERGSEIAGVLPLVLQRSILFGKALISLPFCVEGGLLTSDDDADSALTQAAIDLQNKAGTPYLEFRSRKATRVGWVSRTDLYATFSRSLSPDDKENLLAIPRKQRAVVRKCLESALESEVDGDIGEVFHVYAESVRNLGTPVFSKRYFSTLQEVFGKDCETLTIKADGVAVSAVLNFYHRDTVMPYYGGGTSLARRNGANDFLYWEVMRHAAARGYRKFDFGRSKASTGAFAFKKNWGFIPEWLEYEYHLLPGHSMPDKNPLSPKYALMIQAWKKLPLPIANFLGPRLIRGLG